MSSNRSDKRKSVSFETPFMRSESPSGLRTLTIPFHRPKPPKLQNKMSTFDSLKISKSLSRLQQIEEYYRREGIDPPRPVQGPAHVYGSYQPQPTNLPEARSKNEHRLPTIVRPPIRNLSFDDPELPLPSLDDSFHAAMKAEQEHAPIILQAHSPAPSPSKQSTTFMNWFDLFVRDEKDPAIVYNIRTKEFRATNRAKLLHTEDEAGLIKGNRSLAFEVDNPPLLCDGRMIIAPLPKYGGTVTIKWRNCAGSEVYLREREVSLPAWVLTLRSLGKIDDMFVERV